MTIFNPGSPIRPEQQQRPQAQENQHEAGPMSWSAVMAGAAAGMPYRDAHAQASLIAAGVASDAALLQELSSNPQTDAVNAQPQRQRVGEGDKSNPVAAMYDLIDHNTGPLAELAQGILGRLRMDHPHTTFTDGQGRIRESSVYLQGPTGRPQEYRICYGADGRPTQLLNTDGTVFAAVGQNGVQSIDVNFDRTGSSVAINMLRGGPQSYGVVGNFDYPPSLNPPPHRER